MNKLILISLATVLCLSSGAMYFNTINTIEKHSVHPLYGNYKKFDSNLDKCSPWESCD